MEKTWRRYGASRWTPVEERFWEKVEKTSDCWLWRGGITNHGYGAMTVGPRTFYAHRYSLELALGRQLARTEFACHTCDNPPCVNPAHLFVGSNSDNIRDASRKGRLPTEQRAEWVARRIAATRATKQAHPERNYQASKTHCPQGHPYDEANTIRRSNGNRHCRECGRAGNRKANLQRKARSAA